MKSCIHKIILLAACCLLLAGISNAQDSSHIRISLLTCSPGEEIYSTFGHSAIRVIDSSSVSDIVFNYGTFDFDDPDFYGKFIKGKLLYYLSVQNFQGPDGFEADYITDNRAIIEQVLNLSGEEKIQIENALYNNLQETNRYYKYDFFFDNCTTRLRDLIVHSKHPTPVLAAAMPPGTKFRQAIHEYLDSAHQDWCELFIDLCLGARTDAVMTPEQSEFLPDNLMKSLAKTDHNHNLVLFTQNLFPTVPPKDAFSIFTPTIVLWSLFVLILLIGFSKTKIARVFLRIFDGLLFFITGLTGILLLFMWFGTDHILCKDNYNLLWVWPTNIAVASFGIYRRKWMKVYYAINAVGLIALLGAWFFLPETMNNAFIPVVLLLICRSIYKAVEPATI